MATPIRKEMSGLFWAIIALVLLLPLPLGSVYQWSSGLMSSVVGVVLAIWSARVIFGVQQVNFGLRSVWPLAILFGIVTLWIGLQAQSFTPATWHHPLWSTTAKTLDTDTSSAISLNPFETLSGLARLLAYAGIFWISLQYCRRTARARLVLLAIAYGGLAYALYDLAVQLTKSESIVILREVANLEHATSRFADRGFFATYAGLTLVCCTGLLLMLLAHVRAAASGAKHRALRFIELSVQRGWLLMLTWLMLSLALVLSHSWTGFLSTLLGLLSLFLLAGVTRAADPRLAFALSGLCAAGLVWIIGIGGAQSLARLFPMSLLLEEGSPFHGRTLEAIRDSGMLGTGFGTFEEALRFYRTDDIQGDFETSYVTYLANVLELGIPVASALYCVFAFFLVLCGSGLWQRRRDAVYPCVGFAVTILVSVQALLDSSVQVPAIPATYMLIMGAACAQCWSSRRPVDPW
jgi:hypothetical protein